MYKNNFIIAILGVMVAFFLIFAGTYVYWQIDQSKKSETKEKEKELIGGQKDSHGCLIAAGYSWCEATQKCLRAWEEFCEVAPSENDLVAIKQAFLNKYDKKPNEIQIVVEKFDSRFARGGVKFIMEGEFGSGGIFLAYKNKDVWQIAFDGNGMYSCSEMQSYGFLDEFIPDCANGNPGVLDGAMMANPASTYCLENGGKLEIMNRKIGQYGVCLFEDNRQCEEWALYRGQCPLGGLKVTGYEDEALVYCTITGGQVEGVGTETPMCKRVDGTYCNAQANFDGDCPDPSDPNPDAGNTEAE